MHSREIYLRQLLAAIGGILLGLSVWLVGGLHLSVGVAFAAVFGSFFAVVVGMRYGEDSAW